MRVRTWRPRWSGRFISMAGWRRSQLLPGNINKTLNSMELPFPPWPSRSLGTTRVRLTPWLFPLRDCDFSIFLNSSVLSLFVSYCKPKADIWRISSIPMCFSEWRITTESQTLCRTWMKHYDDAQPPSPRTTGNFKGWRWKWVCNSTLPNSGLLKKPCQSFAYLAWPDGVHCCPLLSTSWRSSLGSSKLGLRPRGFDGF